MPRAVLLTILALAVAAAGLTWAKWLPYTDRVFGIAGSGEYPGTSMLTAGAGEPPLQRAWTFTVAYTRAVWKALAVVLVVLVVGISALVGRVVDRRATRPVPVQRAVTEAVGADQEVTLRRLPGRILHRLFRLSIVLVPEYLLVVFLVGMISEPLSQVLGSGGAMAVLTAAAVGTVLVLLTGGEVPVLLGLAGPRADGAGLTVLG